MSSNPPRLGPSQARLHQGSSSQLSEVRTRPGQAPDRTRVLESGHARLAASGLDWIPAQAGQVRARPDSKIAECPYVFIEKCKSAVRDQKRLKNKNKKNNDGAKKLII